MRKISSIIIFSLTVLAIQGQSVEFGLQIGEGRYEMSDLGIILNEYVVPLDVKIVHEYPPYFYYQPELVYTNDTFSIGLCYSFHSTGARISVQDYSGEYLLDSRIKSHSPAILFKRRIVSFGGFQVRLYNEAGIIFSDLRLNEYLKVINRELVDEVLTYNSVSSYLEPGMSLSFSYRSFTLSANVGYFWQFYSSPLKENETKSTIRVPYIGSEGSPGWSGLRYGVTLSVHGVKKGR